MIATALRRLWLSTVHVLSLEGRAIRSDQPWSRARSSLNFQLVASIAFEEEGRSVILRLNDLLTDQAFFRVIKANLGHMKNLKTIVDETGALKSAHCLVTLHRVFGGNVDGPSNSHGFVLHCMDMLPFSVWTNELLIYKREGQLAYVLPNCEGEVPNVNNC